MRNSLLLAAAPLALLASPALAQDATGTVDISGTVAGRCLFTTDNAEIILGEMALSGTDTNAGKLNAAVINGRNATLVGWCNNAASTMEVEADKLVNTATAAGGFTNSVDYTATAAANSVNATDTTTVAGAGDPADVGMFTGNIVVTLSDAATDGGLLVAGDYSGLVTVTLKPNFAPQ
jgi:hypothetical protein